MKTYTVILTEKEREWLAGLVADYLAMFPDEKIAARISSKLGPGKRVLGEVVVEEFIDDELLEVE